MFARGAFLCAREVTREENRVIVYVSVVEHDVEAPATTTSMIRGIQRFHKREDFGDGRFGFSHS